MIFSATIHIEIVSAEGAKYEPQFFIELNKGMFSPISCCLQILQSIIDIIFPVTNPPMYLVNSSTNGDNSQKIFK